MKINKVMLENYRIHNKYEINFKDGINLLLGDNGSGKSSILEAIGFALFDSKTRSDNKDIVSKGESSGSAKVYFTGNDEKEYEVERKFNSSGSAPAKLTCLDSSQKWVKNEEVYRQIGKILQMDNIKGVFFESVICAKQNQFIDIFAMTDESRAKHFNKLFDTAIYSDLYDKLREQNLRKYEKDKNDREIERDALTSRKKDIAELEKKREQENRELGEDNAKLESIKKDLENEKNELDKYKAQKEQINSKEAELKNSKTNMERLEKSKELDKENLKESEESRFFLNDNKAKFDEYILSKEQSDVWGKELKQFKNATEDYDNLQNQKQELEKKQIELNGRAEQAIGQTKIINESISTKRNEYKEEQEKLRKINSEKVAKINEVESIKKEIETLAKVREEYDYLVKSKDGKDREIMELNKNEKQLSEGTCPVLKVPCLARNDKAFFENKLKELLKEKNEIDKKIDEKKQAPLLLDEKKTLFTELQADIKNIDHRIDECQKNLKKIDSELQKFIKNEEDCIRKTEEFKKIINENAVKLNELNPKIEAALKRKEQEKKLREKIDRIKNEKLDQLNSVYTQCLAKQKTADEYDARKARLSESENHILEETKRIESCEKELNELKGKFSEEQLKLKEESVRNLMNKGDAALVKVTNLKNSIAQIEKDIIESKELMEKVAKLDLEIATSKQKIELTIIFRDNVKDLGSIVLLEQVHRIALIASDYFSKITGRSELISWVCNEDENYSLYLDNGKDRCSFINLSGGEQISVAIAIRLALSQVFGNSGLIILDEPTNNLDKNKRQLLADNLPKMVENLTQLFVITHDNTFEHSATNVIELKS